MRGCRVPGRRAGQGGVFGRRMDPLQTRIACGGGGGGALALSPAARRSGPSLRRVGVRHVITPLDVVGPRRRKDPMGRLLCHPRTEVGAYWGIGRDVMRGGSPSRHARPSQRLPEGPAGPGIVPFGPRPLGHLFPNDVGTPRRRGLCSDCGSRRGIRCHDFVDELWSDAPPPPGPLPWPVPPPPPAPPEVPTGGHTQS